MAPKVELLERLCSNFAACVTSSWSHSQARVGCLSSLSVWSLSLAPLLQLPASQGHLQLITGQYTLLGWGSGVSRDLRVHSVWQGHYKDSLLVSWAQCKLTQWMGSWSTSPGFIPGAPPVGRFVFLIYPAPQAQTKLFLSSLLLAEEAVSFSKSNPRLALD